MHETVGIGRMAVGATEAAKMLGLSERMVRKLQAAGSLPFKRVGTRVLFPVEGLREFLSDDGAAGKATA
ncbi:MAG: helix-turn-helix domain-containing protein [Planctomycetota bacterium]|nr:MAG: helix-turn-helix domain-containing protein [Planctomycetota bacterium]